jgi:WD repeat-containing protein 61
MHIQTTAHDDNIWSVVWSPGGEGDALNRIVSGGLDDTVKAWIWNENHPEEAKENLPKEGGDVPSPLELKYIFEGHSLGVVSVDISHDGRNAVSSSTDCNIRFWDLEAGSPVEATETSASNIDAGPIGSWTTVYSPDGKFIATGDAHGKINLYSTETAKLVTTLNTTGKFAYTVAFSPNGQYVASGSLDDGLIKVFDIETQKVVLSTEQQGHAMTVRCLAFNNDSTQIISGSDDKLIKIFDIATGDVISSLSGHGSWVLSVSVSPDDKHIASR